MEFLTLAKDIGGPLALLVFIVMQVFGLLRAMQVNRGEMVGAEAARIAADAEVTTNTAKMALEGQAQVKGLTGDLKDALTAIGDLRVQVQELTGRVNDLDRENGNKQGKIDHLSHQVKELQAKLLQVEDQLETERRANDALNTIIQDGRRERENLMRQMSSLEAQLKLLSERLKHLDTQELQVLVREIDNIESKENDHEPSQTESQPAS